MSIPCANVGPAEHGSQKPSFVSEWVLVTASTVTVAERVQAPAKHYPFATTQLSRDMDFLEIGGMQQTSLALSSEYPVLPA